MIDLGRAPTAQDLEVPRLGRVLRLWEGRPGGAGFGIEVSEVQLDESVTIGRLRQAWSARRAGGARPVVVFAALGSEQVMVCGPDGSPPPASTLEVSVAERIFAAILDEQPVPAARLALELIDRAQGSGQVPGFRNRNLVSTHYVTQVMPRDQSPEWTDAAPAGERALGQAGEALIKALGYELDATGASEYRVQDDNVTVALAHVYEPGTSLDRVGERQAAPPSTIAVERARELGLGHALLVSGSLLRIYSLRGVEHLDEGLASAAYVELDASLLPSDWAPLLGALAAPNALRDDGRLERIRAASGRYAVALRERFTKRLYEDVVDRLVSGIHDAARQQKVQPSPNEEELYRATLVLLFRLLFLLYAEDRDLLPMGNAGYRANSITQLVLASAEPGRRFDQRATHIWSDIRQLFEAVSAGNADWGVPPYDGGLFRPGGLDHGLLDKVELPNSVMGPALVALGLDEHDGEVGKIDFGALGVRHLGTIYEGLLSYEVAFATEDLRIDRGAKGEPYVPVTHRDVPDVVAGSPHLRSPEGGRKATGTYYTRAFVVDRLIERALVPALQAHLQGLDTDPELSTAELFDFRVADIAMGSGHFLVAALDAIAEGYAAHLAVHPNSTVRAELGRARERLNAVGDAYGSPGLGERVSDLDLLRRTVLKRCVFGVDLNDLAVELARLGLWLHSLVPGLPLSYLGSNLVHGNSLIGVGAEVPGIGIFAEQHDRMAAAKASEVASINDLELGDIERGIRLQRELEDAVAGLRDYYDVATAGPLVETDFSELEQIHADGIINRSADEAIAEQVRQAKAAAASVSALHFRLVFPAVFLRRNRPGFDVIVGNPPWEEAKVERLSFYGRFLPGLHSDNLPPHESAASQVSKRSLQRSAPALRLSDRRRTRFVGTSRLGTSWRRVAMRTSTRRSLNVFFGFSERAAISRWSCHGAPSRARDRHRSGSSYSGQPEIHAWTSSSIEVGGCSQTCTSNTRSPLLRPKSVGVRSTHCPCPQLRHLALSSSTSTNPERNGLSISSAPPILT